VVEFLHVQFVMVFYRNQEVVIRAGDSCEEAIICLSFVKVTMLVRSENLELQKLWKHAFANRKYYHLNEP
jgi:hypothetical protein